MTKAVSFHRLIESDLRSAALYYEAEGGPRLAKRFFDGMEAIQRIPLQPNFTKDLARSSSPGNSGYNEPNASKKGEISTTMTPKCASHLRKPAFCLTFILPFLYGCATADFQQYSGKQQKWPISDGAFVDTKHAVPVYYGPPDQPYIVLGMLDATVAPIRERGTIHFTAGRAKAHGGDAVIILERGKEFVGNFSSGSANTTTTLQGYASGNSFQGTANSRTTSQSSSFPMFAGKATALVIKFPKQRVPPKFSIGWTKAEFSSKFVAVEAGDEVHGYSSMVFKNPDWEMTAVFDKATGKSIMVIFEGIGNPATREELLAVLDSLETSGWKSGPEEVGGLRTLEGGDLRAIFNQDGSVAVVLKSELAKLGGGVSPSR